MYDLWTQYDVVIEQFESQTYVVPDGGPGTLIPINKTPLEHMADALVPDDTDTVDPTVAIQQSLEAGALALKRMRTFNGCAAAYWFQCKALAHGKTLPPLKEGDPPIRALPGTVVEFIPRPYVPPPTVAVSDGEDVSARSIQPGWGLDADG